MKIHLYEITNAIKAPAMLLDALNSVDSITSIEMIEIKPVDGAERPLCFVGKGRIASSRVIETKAFTERCCQ